MRAAALLLLLAACASESVLYVSVRADRVSAQLIAADCSCVQRPYDVGECRSWGDVSAGQCGQCESRCSDLSASRSSDGTSVRIEGCGERSDLEIPTRFPATPSVLATPLDRGTRITWQADELATSVFILATGGFTSESCRLPADLGTHDLTSTSWGHDQGFELGAETEQPAVDTLFGTARLTIGSAPVHLPPPLR